MQTNLSLTANNIDQYSYIVPYVRYSNEDKYSSPWFLPVRKIYDNEFIFVTKGSGEFSIEDRVYPVKPNDLIFLKSDTVHSGKSVSLPFHFICIHFDVFVSSIVNSLQVSGQYLFEAIPSHAVQYEKANLILNEHLSLDDAGYIHVLLKQIIHESEEKHPAFNLVVRSLFTDLLVRLFREQGQFFSSAERFSAEVNEIINYIKKNYMRSIKLCDLSSFTHLQPTYISNLFKKQTGITLSQFIAAYRISMAKELLLETDRKIEDIACSVGFYDIHQFSNVFKKNEGLSPSQFRKIKRYI